MAPILNLPGGFWMAAVHIGGTALPLGATFTFGGIVNGTDTPTVTANAIKTALRATNGPFDITKTFMSSVATLQDILVKYGPLETGPAATVADGGVLGNGGGDAATPATALVINKSTLIGGKRGRGRMFIPGLNEGNVGTGGLVVAATVTALQAAWSQFQLALQNAGRPMYILHRYDPALGQVPMDPTGVTSLEVQSLCGTQRQRMRR
jgi:hypothetical protein